MIKKLENESFNESLNKSFAIDSFIAVEISTRRIRTCQVMVDKLPPLHQHMSDRLQRNIFVLVNYRAYQSRAGKRPSGYRSPDTLNSIPVNWWQESDEQKSLSTFREIDLSNVSCIYIYIYLNCSRLVRITFPSWTWPSPTRDASGCYSFHRTFCISN